MSTQNYPYPVQHKSGAGMNGFLMGLVLGVLLTLLFTTKKGRKILHMLTEEGMSKFSEVEEILKAIEEDKIGAEDEEFAPPDIDMDTTHMVVEETQAPRKPQAALKRITSGRKFFRKPIKK